MFKKSAFYRLVLFFFTLLNLNAMAQSSIKFSTSFGQESAVMATSENTETAALLLKSYLDKALVKPFKYYTKNQKNLFESKIILKIVSPKKGISFDEFIIKSDELSLYLIATNEKTLRYAVYTLLESWGFRKYTATYNYIPEINQFEFLKNTEQHHKPSFEFRSLYYPDCYDAAFRDWHKLDWHLDDFGIWGHSFDKLVSPGSYFKLNPKMFALYEGSRREESLCMSNDTVIDVIIAKMDEIIKATPNAQFYSISQNDDAIYCECEACKKLNIKNGGPQGSLYFFLNKIAKHFPKTKITTLAYLHTFKPPTNLKIQQNIYTIICPISLNRGKSIPLDKTSNGFKNTLEQWAKTNPNLYLWDYTVQFSNYFSPFPNYHTFSDNYKFFQKTKVKGIFAQGYADLPGDFTELRQYILAKLLWNANSDIDEITNDFLRGFYGKAAPEVKKYLDFLKQNQENFNAFLDIYSGPVQSRNTFLTTEQMDLYDQLIQNAAALVKDDDVLAERIQKLRLSLEYVYFEQSKFYGADKHGMFIINKNNQKEVRQGLNDRVKKFTDDANKFKIYELSEGGLSPNNYFNDWQYITKNSAAEHLGEKWKVNFLTPSSPDYFGKGEYGLTDGVRGYKDFNINWIGWYETNPEIEVITNYTNFNQIKINFLEDQRHWIFLPVKIAVYGFINEKYEFLIEKSGIDLEENYKVSTESFKINYPAFKKYNKIKIVIQNQPELPVWRKRKFKKPMVMLDEIEIYNN